MERLGYRQSAAGAAGAAASAGQSLLARPEGKKQACTNSLSRKESQRYTRSTNQSTVQEVIWECTTCMARRQLAASLPDTRPAAACSAE